MEHARRHVCNAEENSTTPALSAASATEASRRVQVFGEGGGGGHGIVGHVAFVNRPPETFVIDDGARSTTRLYRV